MTTQAAISGHEAEHSGPNYIAVFIYLSILTAIELGVYAMGLPQVAKVGLLIALAFAKAVLVAMYFMHLAIERRALAIIARRDGCESGRAAADANAVAWRADWIRIIRWRRSTRS